MLPVQRPLGLEAEEGAGEGLDVAVTLTMRDEPVVPVVLAVVLAVMVVVLSKSPAFHRICNG